MDDLTKIIVSKGFKKLPKVQKIVQSGHTELVTRAWSKFISLNNHDHVKYTSKYSLVLLLGLALGLGPIGPIVLILNKAFSLKNAKVKFTIFITCWSHYLNCRHLIDRISDWPNPRRFTKGVRFVCLNRYVQVDRKPFGQSEIWSIRVLRFENISFDVKRS